MGAFSATCTPRPNVPTVPIRPPTFSESYARCTPSIPKLALAPRVQPTLELVPLRPDFLYQRFVIDRYGSMLIPGVGTLTAMPAPAVRRVVAESPFAAPALAAPTWRFSATGIRLPPITLNAALPPIDVTLSGFPEGFHDTTPAVSERLARPSVPRAPNAVPLPPLLFGMPTSPLIVTPVPPFGLFQTGMPAHWAATGAAATAANAKTVMMRFMRILPRVETGSRHLRTPVQLRLR